MHRPIRPSSGQLARSHGKEPRAVVLPPVLREYDAVLHGQLVHIKVYGKPEHWLPPKISKLPKTMHPGIPPDWIEP